LTQRADDSHEAEIPTSAGAFDEPDKRLPSRLDWVQPQTLTIEAQQVEGDERGSRSAPFGQQGDKGAPSVVPEHHRFAVDQRLVRIQTARRPPTTEQGQANIAALSSAPPPSRPSDWPPTAMAWWA
jgi:hypothetical protein